MATLDLELKHISSVETSIKNAVNELERRQTDYEGIINDIDKIQSNSGNLTDCNIYIKKKNSQLQDKMDRLNSFKNKISTFSENAKSADGRVATYVTDASDTFYKVVGIKTGWSSEWERFKKGCKSVWKTVRDFYEEHKYVIDFVVDTLMLTAAIIAFATLVVVGGPITLELFFVGFELLQAAGDWITSSIALGYHIRGDDENAGIWAERGLKDGMQFIGGCCDEIFEKITGVQTGFFTNLSGLLYDVTSIASVGYGLFGSLKDAKKFIKEIKNKNFRRTKIEGIKILFGINLTPGKSKDGYKKIMKALKITNGRQVYYYEKGVGYVKNIKKAYKLIDSIYQDTFFTDGIQVSKDIKSAYESLTSAGRTIEIMDFKPVDYSKRLLYPTRFLFCI